MYYGSHSAISMSFLQENMGAICWPWDETWDFVTGDGDFSERYTKENRSRGSGRAASAF